MKRFRVVAGALLMVLAAAGTVFADVADPIEQTASVLLPILLVVVAVIFIVLIIRAKKRKK